MIIADAIKLAIESLKKESIANPVLDSRILLAYILNKEVDEIILNQNSIILNEKQKEDFFALVKLRLKKIPISQIIGRREFYGNEFIVNKAVLDPRPDSEHLVSMVINKFQIYFDKKLSIFEIGTGSGCLIISILKHFINFHGLAVDIKSDALDIAKINANKHQIQNRITFLQSDLFLNISKQHKFDIIISNPPYIPTDEIKNLQDEVRLHEPLIALDGGIDGLDFYKKIAQDAKNYLQQDGNIFLEIGINQHHDVIEIFKNNNFRFVEYIKDYNNIIRILQFSL